MDKNERLIVKAADVVQHVQQMIDQQVLVSGDRLPSERVLSEQLKTSRVTTREALKLLEAQGLIYRLNRRGWFVTPSRINYDPSRAMFYMNYVREQGFVPFSKQLAKTRVIANQSLSQLLDIPEGETLVELIRLRGADQRPVYVERILLPEHRLPGIFEHDLEYSVTTVLREFYDDPACSVELNITATSLKPEDAARLQAPTGYTALEIQRISRDSTGELVEFDVECWRHDALNLKVSFDIPE
ncbi:MAG: UTRA domain-containing protein [Marinobacterium sp.]|nr:UTRA domain-containing protein [Marinobacterium sp.]